MSFGPEHPADQEMLDQHAEHEQHRHRDDQRDQGIDAELGGQEEA